MAETAFDPASAARRLAGMWQNSGQLNSLPEGERPQTMAEAYTLQRRLIEEVGEPVRGYKLGLSSTAAMDRTGLGLPIMGFVPQSRLIQSGAVLDAPAGEILLEIEVALELPPGWLDGGAPAAAYLAFEIVRSRFAQRTQIDLPSFVGDASGLHALVVGDPLDVVDLPRLFAGGAVVRQQGRDISTRVTGSELPDPLNVLAKFRELVAGHRMPVEAGMIVATGSLIVPLEIRSGGTFEGWLGPHSVRLGVRRSETDGYAR